MLGSCGEEVGCGLVGLARTLELLGSRVEDFENRSKRDELLGGDFRKLRVRELSA